jgi:hypothetical protein
VLPLHCAFQAKGQLCLLTDFAAGGDLSALLRRQCSLPEAVARVYVAELVLALAHLHTLGIVHRGEIRGVQRPALHVPLTRHRFFLFAVRPQA